ncbi:MAG TPA: hypothetical protein VFE22_02490, partial [Edaphobacter sp.]|nr:hypothetical protein [Edaphobacter sp.]
PRPKPSPSPTYVISTGAADGFIVRRVAERPLYLPLPASSAHSFTLDPSYRAALRRIGHS